MLNPNLNKIEILPHEYKQYARHIILEQVGLHGQKRIKQAKVLIIGAGGLGCPAILYLAASGIGNIGILDYDNINISNLNRQILYKYENISNLKNSIAKESIQSINSQCNITTFTEKLNLENGHKILKQYDIILDCTDNFKTRYIIDQICFSLHKPHIYGAVQKFEGQISVFNYKSSIRYSDIYNISQTSNIQQNNCNDLGILGVITGTIGILQATEALKIILGIGNILSDKLLLYNLLTTNFKIVPINYCKYIKQKPRSFKINMDKQNQYISYEMMNLLHRYGNRKITLIDVRDPIDFYINHIKYSINIPLKQFSYQNTYNFLSYYLNNTQIILYCHQIKRSLIAFNILKKQMQNISILYDLSEQKNMN